MTPILELRGVSKSFRALMVLNDISFTLNPGEALGVLGPNGAGKTTMLNLISGDLPVSSGQIVFQGVDITRMPAERRCRMGIGRTAQIPRPFAKMTVFENVLVAATYGRGKGERDSYALCRDILRQTGLFEKQDVLAGNLRILGRKRLELARALATEPTLLLLDEIAGGLTDHEVYELLEVIANIRARGITIVWIEHIVHALLSSVDRILAINFGTKLAEGLPRQVIESPEFQEIYFGVESVRLEGSR
ncbi:MAG: ABC transporter ATP-binding protein [Anaerolineae bacterium]|nr:ABC transporter ATP-binding protein [Anaerolineae bacterium]